MYLLVIRMFSLDKCLFSSSAYFFISNLLSCICYLYVLDIISLFNVWFVNLSHSVGCLCIFLLLLFAGQKLISLMEFHLLILTFIVFSFGVYLKNHCKDKFQRVLLLFYFSPIFSFKHLQYQVRYLNCYVNFS